MKIKVNQYGVKEVYARVEQKYFGIYKRRYLNEEGNWKDARWRITHIPTGLTIFHYCKNYCHALDVIDICTKIVDWNFKSLYVSDMYSIESILYETDIDSCKRIVECLGQY